MKEILTWDQVCPCTRPKDSLSQKWSVAAELHDS